MKHGMEHAEKHSRVAHEEENDSSCYYFPFPDFD